MNNKGDIDLSVILKQILKKFFKKKKYSSNNSDDEYKEEPIRDYAKEKRKEFLKGIKIKPEDYEKRDIHQTSSVSRSREKGMDRLLHTKRYEGIENIPQITDSDIWKCKADFSDKQQTLIRNLVQLESVKMGISRPKVIFLEMDDKDKTLGYYDYKNKIIFINSSTKGTVKHLNLLEVIDTATHELRHSYQHCMLEHPEKFPFIDGMIRHYYEYENEIYPDDDRLETDEGLIEYLENALEVDARSYAEESVAYYIEKTLPEIESLDSVIEEPVHNQILVGLRDEVPSGNNPLMAVGKDFETFKEKKKADKLVLSATNLRGSSLEETVITNKYNNVKGEQRNMASGMTGATDLSETAQQTAAKRYMEVVQNIQNNCENMIRSFEERIKDHPYKKLQHVANTFIELHNTMVPAAIKEAIQEWSRSDESFSKLLQDLDEDCSQESINAAEKLQNNLADQVDSYFISISEISIDKPIQVNADIIRQDQAFVDSWLKELSALKGQWKTKFENLSDENSIYANMISMVVSTFTNVESVYQSAESDTGNVAEEFNEKRKSNIGNAIRTGETKVSDIKDSKDVFAALRKKKR